MCTSRTIDREIILLLFFPASKPFYFNKVLRSVSKYTAAERALVKSIVATLSIKTNTGD
jgi:hypothetical protein